MIVLIRLTSYNKNPNIGVACAANDSVALLPLNCPPGFSSAVSAALGANVHHCNVCGTFLIGSLVALNNKGLLLPRHVYEEELKKMKKLGLEVGVISDKLTALGNLILANDNGAVISKAFSRKARTAVEDTLDCEVGAIEISKFKTVGSIGVATNKGALMHPLISDKEAKLIEDILKVNVNIGTVNRGIGFVKTGLVANANGALVGSETTGPEILRIEDSLLLAQR